MEESVVSAAAKGMHLLVITHCWHNLSPDYRVAPVRFGYGYGVEWCLSVGLLGKFSKMQLDKDLSDNGMYMCSMQ